jgi:ABC-2 type transport system permease protein
VAVLATPATIADVLAAKGIFGTALAFSEAMLLGILIGALAVNTPLVIVALLLGSILVTGFGLLAGAFGKDFLGTMVVAMLFMVPLMVPAFGALFPGSTAAWIKALPTYGLVDTVVGVTAYGESWGDVGTTLLVLAAWGAAAFVVGAAVLRRRVITL